MKTLKTAVLPVLFIMMGVVVIGVNAQAQSNYFSARGCTDCHSTPVAATCAGCHHHSGSLSAALNKTTAYAPGETVTVTLSASGARTGWVGVRLYDQTGAEIARSTGTQSGMGGSATLPAALSAAAPATPGAYTWRIAYFGNEDGTGTGDVHSEKSVNISFTVASATDTTVPVVSAFTLPATSASLTVPVSAFTATDNVGVTGYLVTTTASVPLVSAAGWTAAAPASITASAAGAVTFYAWAKDAAGNVSASRSASVTITLPDTTVPVVSAFTLPATATSLNVPVTAFTATDNVGVTGYLVTQSATAPAAASTAWTASAPSNVTAAAAGTATFYAWAKDAAGNVSLAKSASVVITLPDTAAPVVSAFTLPATATSLTIPVTAFVATDNLAVAGYLITQSAAAPAASAAGWLTAPPASVTVAAAGSATFYAWAKDAAGNVSLAKSATVTVTVAGDTTKPVLTISALADGAYTNKSTLNVSGVATDDVAVKSVTVNDQPVTVNADGSFSTALVLAAGANTVTVVATDNAGNQQSDSRSITYDPTAPVLAVSAPADNITTTESFVALTGSISETSTVSVKVNNGSPQSASISGTTFTSTVYLVPGINTIDITATDLAGNSTSAKRTITYEAGTLSLAITSPSRDITTSESTLTIKGKIVDAQGAVTVKVTMDGRTYTPAVRRGAFSQKLIFRKAGVYAIGITATDAAGNTGSVTRNVIYRPGERDDRDDDHSRDDD